MTTRTFEWEDRESFEGPYEESLPGCCRYTVFAEFPLNSSEDAYWEALCQMLQDLRYTTNQTAIITLVSPAQQKMIDLIEAVPYAQQIHQTKGHSQGSIVKMYAVELPND